MLDWRLLATTFATIFLAELGDKTQLATFTLSAGTTSRWSVFLGAALALVASSAVGVLAGTALARWVPMVWLHRAAGVLMLGLGVWLLVSKPS